MHLAENRYVPGTRQAAHVHDFTSLSLLVRGTVEERAACLEHRGVAGDVIVRPAGTLHEDLFGEAGAKTLTLVVEGEVGSYRWLQGGSPAALFARAAVEWRAGAEYGEIVTDLLAAIHDGGSAGRPSALREVAERVETTAVSVEALARELSMHPVSLARLFRRAHGVSITAWRRRARVRRAAALLTTGRSLAEVALESGFSDQSHLCRVFRTEMGITPSAFRHIAV